ncbi:MULTISPECIES: hemolysin family protein [Sphingomonas]|uniref:hemolysin family protein n=1 Tax=Sphingomonas TaxID=13687 RepID=UPI000DEF7B99|nr:MULTISPECIES: hemolysin family protein [Sphingomonas]
MATSPDSGSRLWRGMRHLFFGGDSDHSLRDQIEEVIDEAEEHRGGESSDLSPLERQMLRNLLHFGDRTAGDICVTRGEIISAPSSSSMAELAKIFAEAGHSRLPLTGESLDEVVGMVHIKDVFNAYFDATERKSVAEIIREPLFVPESMGVIDLLARMRAQRVHLALVVDEFGGTEGLVTIEDVVEEIVGDIADEHDEEVQPLLAKLDDGLWEADARCELDELAQAVDKRLVAEDDEVDTLGGLAFMLAGRILAPGESVAHPSGWRLESVAADDRKMHRLRLHAPDPAAADA